MVARNLPGLGLTGFWPLGQNGWKDANDLNLRVLSVVGRGWVKSRTTVLPSPPAAGETVYIVPSDDVTNPNKIGVWDGEAGAEAWVYLDPQEGMWFFVDDAAERVQYVDGAWVAFSAGGGGGGGGAATAYRYWRLRLTSETQKTASGTLWLFELEFRSTAGVQETATGGTVISSGWTNPTNAFGTSRASAASPFIDKFIGYDFGSEKTVEEVLVAYDTTFASAPTNYVIEASTDNVTWVVAAQVSLADVTGDQVFSVSTVGGGSAVEEVAGTIYTQVAADSGKWKRTTNGAAVAITIDANVNKARDEITWEQGGAGLVTFAAGAGMTLTSRGGALASAGQHAVMGVKFRSPTEATLFGDIA